MNNNICGRYYFKIIWPKEIWEPRHNVRYKHLKYTHNFLLQTHPSGLSASYGIIIHFKNYALRLLKLSNQDGMLRKLPEILVNVQKLYNCYYKIFYILSCNVRSTVWETLYCRRMTVDFVALTSPRHASL